MQQKTTNPEIKVKFSSLVLKCGAMLLLFVLSVVVAACGANADTTSAAAQPQPTTTINLNGSLLTPTPTIPPQACGVWLVNASPNYNPKGVIPVYGKFVKMDANGNPVGIGGASVNFIIAWGDMTNASVPAVTSNDGLATINLPMGDHPNAINRLSLITAQFSAGNVSCQVDSTRPQSFVVIAGAKPTTTATATAGDGGGKRRRPGTQGATGGTQGGTPSNPILGPIIGGGPQQ